MRALRPPDREGPDQGPPVRHALHQGQEGRGAGRLRARRALVLYGTAGGAYIADRLTKILAEELLQGRPPVEIIPSVVQLRFTTNPGGAFGLFGNVPGLFVAISVLVVGAVVIASRDLPSTGSAVGLGLVLAGAVGNLTDRAIRGPGFSGEVVDFIDFHVWPVFNLADSALVIGAAVLVLAGIRRDRAVRRHPSAR